MLFVLPAGHARRLASAELGHRGDGDVRERGAAAPLDHRRVVATLERDVIGAIAAIAAGAPVMTTDLEVTPDRSRKNLERLSRALDDLQARLRSRSDPEGVMFPVDADMLESADSWTLLTRSGNLDVVFSPAGTGGYEDLRRAAKRERIAGVAVPVASLADVIRCKEAAGGPKDLMQLPILRLTLEEIRRRERGDAS